MSTLSLTSDSVPVIHWEEAGLSRSALWRSERAAPPPKQVVLADDTMNADTAYRLACEGTALLWRGDFQNARQLLQALARRADQSLARRIDKPPHRVRNKPQAKQATPATPADSFNQHRQAQSQRGRVLGMVLLNFEADYSVALRRAPDVRLACSEAWGREGVACVASLRELQGLISAHEWRKNGVEIPALGKPPNNRIHPHYGVFSPVRGEYVDLVAKAPLPVDATSIIAFDIGTGTGVLAAVLARRGVKQIIGTDQDPRALDCARSNLKQLGVATQVQVVQANLFPEGKNANLIVCNPPWLPARPGSPIEHAVYDEGGKMLLGFLNGVKTHLAPKGEAWLILSDFAEHLGLRTREELLAAIEAAGLKVVARLDAKPLHPKASDVNDPLHAARAAEVTSLWRLVAHQE